MQNSERLCEHLGGFVWKGEAMPSGQAGFVPPAARAGTHNDVKFVSST